ncbi:group I truncated hemoglobin [Actinoplanes sp. RD1]|uniref:group I truncated hemoglobin n=1 Tax=Actinoplanes sp. RD1 TaxID=3064538 RepID=UPI0027424A45|nr:group 1 truncated hemoglobin [Actinoplanes sp. RD1]
MDGTLYSRIGGATAVTTAVDALYRAVLGDPRLAGFFAEVDLDGLKRHMGALLSQTLGGPADYTGRELRAAHDGLHIGADDYALVGAYLIGVLAALQAGDDVLREVRGILGAVEADVVE